MALFNRIIDRLLFYLLSATLAGVVGICLLQVVARYVFSASFTWADEISVVLLIWATWGAACLALKQGIHLNVRFVPERLTQRTNLMVKLFLNALALLFLSIVSMASKPVLEAMKFQTLMSLPEISINIMYTSVPAGCALMIYYILRLIVEDATTLASLAKRGR